LAQQQKTEGMLRNINRGGMKFEEREEDISRKENV